MKKIIILIMLILLCSSVLGVNWKTKLNPFTKQRDYYVNIDNLGSNLNLSDYNVTAEYFKGDGSLLTGISGGGNTTEEIFSAVDNDTWVRKTGDNISGFLTVDDNTTSYDFIIPNMNINSRYNSLNDFFRLFTSAGRISGGSIYNNNNQSINVSSGSGVIRIADDDISQVKFFDWDNRDSFFVTNDTVMYIGIEYNSGNPQVINKSSDTWDYDTEFPLGSVINQEGDLYIKNDYWLAGDSTTNVIERFKSFGLLRDENVGGLILGYTGTRNPTLSSGKVWSLLNEFDITVKDTSGADTFYQFYRDGSNGWYREGPYSQWNNTHYDDGSGSLVEMNQNKYANIWVFIEIDSSNGGQLMLIFPQNQYSAIASAIAEEVPSFPSSWYEHGVLVGRIIFKKGVDEPIEVQSVFTTLFNPSQAAIHGNLAGLSDDDHLQYLLTNGLRQLSGNWDTSGYNITADTFIYQKPPSECPSGTFMTRFIGNVSICVAQSYNTTYDIFNAVDNNTFVTFLDKIGNTTAEIRNQFSGSDNITIVDGVISYNGTVTSGGGGGNTTEEIRAVVGWNDTGSNVILSTTSDYVGIGTTSPGAKLVIKGTGVLLNITNGTDSSFYVDQDTGRVGIGTTNPAEALHIKNGQIRLEGDTTGVNAGEIAIVSDIMYIRGTSQGIALTQTGAVSNTMYLVESTGNVGLGISNPTAKLEVSGNVVFLNNLTVNSQTLFVDSDSNNVGVGTKYPNQHLSVSSSAATELGLLSTSTQDNSRNWAFRTNTHEWGDFVIKQSITNSTDPTIGITRFLIDFDGDVGIGDNSPDGDLDIGNSYVNSGDTQWTSESHSSFKENITEIPVDANILTKFGSLKIYNWSYKKEHLRERLNLSDDKVLTELSNKVHSGLMADEFNPLIMKHNSTVLRGDDIQNTMFQAIQMLIKENNERKLEINLLKSESCKKDDTYSWCK
ncbi:MAG: hypothetical protein ACTSX6_04760 [Candidatus Heimdallarchaeaceae archaeon]